MSTSKANFRKITAVLAILLTAYFIATLAHADTLGNILSPLNAFTAAGILIFSYWRSDRTVKISVVLLLCAFACTVWGIADIIWAVISFSGGAPDDNPVIWVIYVLTNCFLVAALVVFAIQQFRKWDLVQISIDLIISGFLTGFMFWILFLNKDVSSLMTLLSYDFTSVLSILTDIMICICVFSWFLSVRGGKIPVFMHILSFGLVLFSFEDLFYYYLDYNGLYFPNSMNDFLYILSLVIIAFSALWKTYKNSSALDLSAMTNTGGRARWVYLLLYPLLAVLLSLTGIIDIQLNFNDYMAFTVPIFLYWAFCKYVQLALEKEALLKTSNQLLEQRVAEQVSELTFLANQDSLTKLFNRRYFMTCLEDTISSRRQSDTIALMIIDMDRFKTINDRFGHDIGDQVLLDLSYRMIEWNSCGATIARLGGDEFAVMFTGKYTQQDIEDFCMQIIDSCSKPFSISDYALTLTMSVGIALASPEISDGQTLMQDADIALYQAKSQGYNKFYVYDSLSSQDFKKAVEIEVLLRQTDAERDFELFYQPQYALPGKELIGAEALLRWKHAEHGYIPPNVFIPIAEQIDYIHKIGKWVMQETINQSIKWNKQYQLPLKIGFNISAKQFNDDGFVSLIKTLVTHSGINPAWIDAEITEGVMLNDGDNIEQAFTVLKELGITVSIDDFGSGYSSLGYLNKYPFDRIKIDKSLVDNISLRNISGANVIRAAVNMAHASGIQTIAEGVETFEQLDILMELGCDQIQGYLLGRPVPAEVFEQRYIKPYIIKDHIS